MPYCAPTAGFWSIDPRTSAARAFRLRGLYAGMTFDARGPTFEVGISEPVRFTLASIDLLPGLASAPAIEVGQGQRAATGGQAQSLIGRPSRQESSAASAISEAWIPSCPFGVTGVLCVTAVAKAEISARYAAA